MNGHAVQALVEFTARRVFAGKRTVALCFLLLVPPAVAGVIAILHRSGVGGPPSFDVITFHLSLYLCLVLTAMIYGIALTSSEIEDGTAAYVLLGACPRWFVALVHVLATAPILAALTTGSVALTYLACVLGGTQDLRPMDILRDGFVAGVALTAYLSFFVFCGYTFKHNVAVSVASVLIWEFLIAIMPVKFAAYTVVINTRVLWLYLTQEGERGRWFAGVAGYDLPTYGEASMFLSVAIAFFLTLSMVAAMNRSIAGREAA